MAVLFTSTCRVPTSIKLVRCICNTAASFTGKGIRGAVKGLGIQEEELQELDPDDLENMTEPYLNTFNQEAANIASDAKKYQDHLRQKTIEHKYFKSCGPKEENLLTWSMKEQLKYLNSTDPNQWTPEVLSESFPISPEGVLRLVQSHWVPKSETERQRHDRAVVARWKRHMKGQLGSFRILEKTLNEKFIPENLPSPVGGMNQILSLLHGLIFDGEKPHVATQLKKRNQFPKQLKRKGKSFYSIIEDFKTQTYEGRKPSIVNTNINNLVVISGPPVYEDSYSKVTGSGSTVMRNRYADRKGELMTFTDFMKKRV